MQSKHKVENKTPLFHTVEIGNFSTLGCGVLINLASDGVLKVALHEDISV